MRWRDGKRYGNIEDRRGMRAGRAGGGISIGAIAIVLIGYFVFGVDPATLISVVQQGQSGYSTQQAGRQGTPDDERGQFVDTILSSTTDVWSALFAAEGKAYRESGPLVLYTQATGTRCGMGQSVMGPFYCPADERIYIDLVFFDELATRYGAPGEFAQAYVIAHEVGHHVQTVLGTSRRVLTARQNARSEAEANRYSVMQELQADCYAGVWAANAEAASNGGIVIERGDLEGGLQAAHAIGDDTLQKRGRGHVVPDSFTHGTSAQRMEWLRRGYDTGDPATCDTFSAASLR